jgi:hypothetical protein
MCRYSHQLVDKFFKHSTDIIQSVIACIFALFVVGLIVFNVFFHLKYLDEDKKREVMRKQYSHFFEGLK